MREIRTYESARGVPGNRHSYRNYAITPSASPVRRVRSPWECSMDKSVLATDSTVAALMRTPPCSVSGDHPSWTRFANLLLPLVSPPLHGGWDTAFFVGTYPMFTSSPCTWGGVQ